MISDLGWGQRMDTASVCLPGLSGGGSGGRAGEGGREGKGRMVMLGREMVNDLG